MLFEMWLKAKGHDLKKLTKKEGRALYKEFGEIMVPAVRDCTNFWNAALRHRKDYNGVIQKSCSQNQEIRNK